MDQKKKKANYTSDRDAYVYREKKDSGCQLIRYRRGHRKYRNWGIDQE